MSVNLRAERINRGLSVVEAAEAMDVAVNVLENAEGGRTTPHPRNAFKIASFYGFKVTDVWPLEEPVERNTA